MSGLGATRMLWCSAREPGPFVPHTSMPWSRGPEHVAEAPCTPTTRRTTLAVTLPEPASEAPFSPPPPRWTYLKADRA